MTIALIILVTYIGVPLLIAALYWQNGQAVSAAWWCLACLVLPIVTLFISSVIFGEVPYANGGPGTVWDNFLYSGITAGAGWVLLTLAAFLCAPILRDEQA